MSQGWSVCHVSETTKQTGAGKSIFVPSFLEKKPNDLWYIYYMSIIRMQSVCCNGTLFP